jgi:membrane protease YdiL (CAAX protease family)
MANWFERGARISLFIALITFAFSFIIGFKGIFFLGLTIFFFFLSVFIKSKEYKNWRKGINWFVDFYKEIALYFLGVFVIVTLISLFFDALGVKLSNLDALLRFAPPTSILLIGLLAGPIEELIFRAGILKFTKKILYKFPRYNELIALIVSSLIFAIAHIIGSSEVYTIFYIIPTFIIGFIFGKIYLKRGLLEVMWLHSLYNMFGLLLDYMLIHGWGLI